MGLRKRGKLRNVKNNGLRRNEDGFLLPRGNKDNNICIMINNSVTSNKVDMGSSMECHREDIMVVGPLRAMDLDILAKRTILSSSSSSSNKGEADLVEEWL